MAPLAWASRHRPAPATSLEKQPADRPAAEAPQERQAPPPEGSPWFAGQQGPVQYVRARAGT
ncbi:hypothetical protein ACFWFX_15770, partial [Streptomyces roseolus]